MQAAPEFHGKIGKIRRVVAERLLEHPGALGPCEAVLHPHAGTGQVPVVPFLARLELAVARLFFG